ncbi:Hypp6567 [Branchiostoma lanceolatum]|uniref:Hypp6567 protein n=1 Tax=Branchiostoma lanceolatum TaxID=7740 RepID=A0A8K0E4V8_BRALA|nr:Hypp6567 [Branchiostoma lanceolatum]
MSNRGRRATPRKKDDSAEGLEEKHGDDVTEETMSDCKGTVRENAQDRRRYIELNVRYSEGYSLYSDKLQPFLKNRPRDMVLHIQARYDEAQVYSIDNIIATERTAEMANLPRYTAPNKKYPFANRVGFQAEMMRANSQAKKDQQKARYQEEPEHGQVKRDNVRTNMRKRYQDKWEFDSDDSAVKEHDKMAEVLTKDLGKWSETVKVDDGFIPWQRQPANRDDVYPDPDCSSEGDDGPGEETRPKNKNTCCLPSNGELKRMERGVQVVLETENQCRCVKVFAFNSSDDRLQNMAMADFLITLLVLNGKVQTVATTLEEILNQLEGMTGEFDATEPNVDRYRTCSVPAKGTFRLDRTAWDKLRTTQRERTFIDPRWRDAVVNGIKEKPTCDPIVGEEKESFKKYSSSSLPGGSASEDWEGFLNKSISQDAGIRCHLWQHFILDDLKGKQLQLNSRNPTHYLTSKTGNNFRLKRRLSLASCKGKEHPDLPMVERVIKAYCLEETASDLYRKLSMGTQAVDESPQGFLMRMMGLRDRMWREVVGIQAQTAHFLNTFYSANSPKRINKELTPEETKWIKRWLRVKDKFNISDSAFHEIRMLGQERVPPLYRVIEERKEQSKMIPIITEADQLYTQLLETIWASWADDAPALMEVPVEAPAVMGVPVEAPAAMEVPVEAPAVMEVAAPSPPAHRKATMAAPTVLRSNATLVGHSVVPLITKISDQAVPTPPDELLARIEAEVPLRRYDAHEILERIGTLTCEPPEALLRMTGLDTKDQESAVRLAHFTIRAANEIQDGQDVSKEEAAVAAAL